ncbi:hypothetical protein GGI16_008107, partial [Coemansia sp. S142-1]
GSLNPSYRRPSMPIFPTFGYAPGDMLGMSGSADTMSTEQGLYGVATSQQDSSAGMVATAAADAVAVALGERTGGGPTRTRVADVPGRRRTMHVPPLLLEGVATAEFANPGANAYMALGIGAQQGRHGSAPYLPRPTGQTTAATAALTRGRRSRTISSNSNTQATARLGATGSAMPSAARPPLPPVSEASDTRHARSYSGTQLTQDVPMDAMTTLSAGEYASFKPWPLDMEADCMHDETRSLIDMPARDAPARVDLYRPASSTGHHRYTAQASGGSARNHSPALVSTSATVTSPVAPRSAASTPGRREAVGM